MLQNAYFLAKIGADTAENEQHFAEILRRPKTPLERLAEDLHGGVVPSQATRSAGPGGRPRRPLLECAKFSGVPKLPNESRRISQIKRNADEWMQFASPLDV